MRSMVKHLTRDFASNVGESVRAECGRSIVRRDPTELRGLRECVACRTKANKRPEWNYVTSRVETWSWPE